MQSPFKDQEKTSSKPTTQQNKQVIIFHLKFHEIKPWVIKYITQGIARSNNLGYSSVHQQDAAHRRTLTRSLTTRFSQQPEAANAPGKMK